MHNFDLWIPDSRWFDAPHERTPQFFQTYSAVSIALQAKLRELLPAEYFADLSRFENERLSYAILAYSASRPFRPKTRTDFTYDVTNTTAMAGFYRLSRRKLIASLERAQARLLAAGRPDLAKLYEPNDIRYILKAIKKQKRIRRPMHRLLVAEGKLVNELTAFSGLDQASFKERRKQAARITKTWRSTLQRICLDRDLRAIGPQLFEAVTEVYLTSREPRPASEVLDLAA
jgi:hypothetical protein